MKRQRDTSSIQFSKASILVEWIRDQPVTYSVISIDDVVDGEIRSYGKKLKGMTVVCRWGLEKLPAVVHQVGGHVKSMESEADRKTLEAREIFNRNKATNNERTPKRRLANKPRRFADDTIGVSSKSRKLMKIPRSLQIANKIAERNRRARNMEAMLGRLGRSENTTIFQQDELKDLDIPINDYENSATSPTGTPQAPPIFSTTTVTDGSTSAVGTTQPMDESPPITLGLVGNDGAIVTPFIEENETLKGRVKALEAENFKLKEVHAQAGIVMQAEIETLKGRLIEISKQEQIGPGMFMGSNVLATMVTDARGHATALALALFRRFFSSEELSSSSWDGRTSNANGDIDTDPSPGLDAIRRDAITDFAILKMEKQAKFPPLELQGEEKDRWVTRRATVSSLIRSSVGKMCRRMVLERFPEKKRSRPGRKTPKTTP